MKLFIAVRIIIQLTILAAIGLAGGLFVAARYGYIEPVRLYVVMSGSMEPAIKLGSIVAVTPKVFGYAPGDIITFGKSAKDTTTHRITQLIQDQGTIAYKTQGDANKTEDAGIIKADNILGSVFLTMPYVGYAVNFAKTPQGFILLVIVPATIIIYEELRFIKNQLAQIAQKLAKRGKKIPNKAKKGSKNSQNISQTPLVPAIAQAKSPSPSLRQTIHQALHTPIYTTGKAPLPPQGHPLERLFQTLPPATHIRDRISKEVGSLSSQTTTPPEAGVSPSSVSQPLRQLADPSSSFNRHLIVIPAIAVTTIFIGLTGSYFLDQEASIGNILSAGTWASPVPSITPGPTPGVAQTLVINEVMPDSSCEQGGIEAQWLEVYNGYATEVNLKSFKITDGTNTIDLVTAASVIVPPGGYALLSHNTSIWNQCYSSNGSVTSNLGGSLNIDVGLLRLLDSQSTVIDTVAWGGDTGHSPVIDQSIERAPYGWDSAFGEDFNPTDFIVQGYPRPGYGEHNPSVVINEYLPNPIGGGQEDDEFIELYNRTGAPVDLTGWQLDDEAGGGATPYLLSDVIPANGFLTLTKATTNVGLNNPGDSVRLINASGAQVDGHFYNQTVEGQTYGRDTDGDFPWQTCTTPTPNAFNAGSC